MEPFVISKPVRLAAGSIVLRDLTEADVTQDYVDWMNDPEVVQYMESRFEENTMASIRTFVRSCAKDPGTLLLGIFSADKGLHIGNIKLGPVNLHHRLGDIGLVIGRKDFWGQGVASTAIAAVRDYAFTTLGLIKVTAGCYEPNAASARAFVKVGFCIEASRPLHLCCGSGRVNALEFGAVNPEFIKKMKPELTEQL